MADLIYMTKAAWTAITNKVRGKTGSSKLEKYQAYLMNCLMETSYVMVRELKKSQMIL